MSIEFNTKDGGKVQIETGCIDSHLLSVTHLNRDQDPETAMVHMSNLQAYELALYILHNTEIMVNL